MKANERFTVGQRVRFGYPDSTHVIGVIKEITFGGSKAGVEPSALVETEEDGTRFITPQSMISQITDDEPGDELIPATSPIYYGASVSPGAPAHRRNDRIPLKK